MTEKSSNCCWRTRIISGDYRPRQFEYNLDGTSILFGTLDGKVCNVSSSFDEDNQINDFGLFSKNPSDSILGLCWFRKNYTKFITGSGEGLIKLGDINPINNANNNNHIVKEYFEFEKLTSLHINCEDDYMLISGSTNNIRINDLKTGDIVRQYDNIHNDFINICRFSNYSPNLFATSSFDKSAKLWDMRIKNKIPIYSVNCKSPIVMLTFSPDDSFLLLSAQDNEIEQILTATGKVHTSFSLKNTGLENNYRRSYYSSSGSLIFTGACEQSTLSILCAATGDEISNIDLYSGRKSNSLYIQTLRGNPAADNHACALANYRDSGDRELIIVDIPLNDVDYISGLSLPVALNYNKNIDSIVKNFDLLPILPPIITSIPSPRLYESLNNIRSQCKISISSSSSTSSSFLSSRSYPEIDKENPDIDVLLECKDNSGKLICYNCHSFIISARCRILLGNNWKKIDVEDIYIPVIDISMYIDESSVYLVDLLLDYFYCGNDAIEIGNIRLKCLEDIYNNTNQDNNNNLSNWNNSVIFEKEKRLKISKMDNLWKSQPLDYLLIQTINKFMKIANNLNLVNLETLIEKILSTLITTTTAIEILNISESYGRVKLRSIVMRYLLQNIDVIISIYGIDSIDVLLLKEIYKNQKEHLVEIKENISTNIKGISNIINSTVVNADLEAEVENEYVFDEDNLSYNSLITKQNGDNPIHTHLLPIFIGHQCVKIRDNKMLVLGGANKFRYHSQSYVFTMNIDTGIWTQNETKGSATPSSLIYHISSTIEKTNARHVISIGGQSKCSEMKIISEINVKNKTMLKKYSKKEFKNDEEKEKITKLLIPPSVYLLDTLTMKWSAPDIYVDKTNIANYIKIISLFHRTSHSLCAIYKDDCTDIISNSFNIIDHSQKPYDVNNNCINYSNSLINIERYNNNINFDEQYLSNDNNNDSDNKKENDYIQNKNYNGNVKIYEKYETFFILFGGYCAKNHVLENDIHILACKSRHNEIDNNFIPKFESDFIWQWIHPNVRTIDGSTPPDPRLGHTSTILRLGSNVNPRMILFGGVGYQNAFNEVHSLKCDGIIDTIRSGSDDISELIWENVTTNSPSPLARHGHSMIALSKACQDNGHHMILFGGLIVRKPSNDLWIMNVLSHGLSGLTISWEKLKFNGIPPIPRIKHCCLEWNDKIIVFGGNNDKGSNIDNIPHILELSLDNSIESVWLSFTSSIIGNNSEPVVLIPRCSISLDLLTHLCELQKEIGNITNIKFNVENLNIDNEINNILTINSNNNNLIFSEWSFLVSNVLAKERSPTLCAMLNNGLKESLEKEVRINGYNISVVSSFLIYLYTDLICVSNEDLISLLYLSDQFFLDNLKKILEHFLIRHIDESNLMTLLSYSHLLHLQSMKFACFSLLSKKNISISKFNNNNTNNNNVENIELEPEILIEFELFLQNYYAHNFEE